MNSTSDPQPIEWLETDGLGGFASGTASGIRTRRYHALLLVATTPPTGRIVLVNGFDAWIETPAGRFELTSQRYAPDIIGGSGARHVEQFTSQPWPRWIYKFEDGTRIEQEILVARESQLTQVCWRWVGRIARRAPSSLDREPKNGAHGVTSPTAKQQNVRLFVRPFLSGRDYHSLHKENSVFRFDALVDGERVIWNPYPGVPAVVALSNGYYQHEPHWYRNFRYADETARGLDDTEDLAAPGVFHFDLASGEAALMFTTQDSPALSRKRDLSAVKFAEAVRANEELRRAEFPSRLHRAADDYIVCRVAQAFQPSGSGGFSVASFRKTELESSANPQTGISALRKTAKTIIAGYPWFTDWGRDTFIALRGLCLATGRLADARDILLAWADSVSEGMLPNVFPDHGAKPEYNSVDASLWYVIAVHEYLEACSSRRKEAHSSRSAIGNRQSKISQSLLTSAATNDEPLLHSAILAILDGYSRGTRFGIRMDDDGLLAAGERAVQLTWMDAKIGEWVVTPRAGKPVEIQALWLNALKIASRFEPQWEKTFNRGLKSFRDKFWNENAGCLYDVVDAIHRTGELDATFRPNQIFAVGGLPFQLLEGERAKKIVSLVEEKLLTPLGLRSLAPGEPDYKPHYEGGILQRDGSYHQGTVWPWLIGPFVEAWVRVHGNTTAARREAREKFLIPLLGHLVEAGLGHISEIADAEAPHTPRGCPFQAWSVGEALRLDQVVLAKREEARTSVRFTAPQAGASRIAVTVQPKKIGAPSRPRATRPRATVTV